MTDPIIVHTVVGEEGCYSDWTTWLVAGYFKGDDAKTHADRLNKIIECFKKEADAYVDGADNRAVAALSEYDPDKFPPGKYTYLREYSLPHYSVSTLTMKDKP